MINSQAFFTGLTSLKGARSPALPLAACFVALGALLKDAGFNIQQSAASSFFTYALPGQLVMAESLLLGASIVNIFLAVWLVNFRLYPMTVSLFKRSAARYPITVIRTAVSQVPVPIPIQKSILYFALIFL